MGIAQLLTGGAVLVAGVEIFPQPVRHPFCSEFGCKSEHSLQTSNILFCGGCERLPSDVSAFPGLTAPRVLLTDSASNANILKLENHTLQLRPKKFGQYNDSGDVTPNTSSLAHDIMQHCQLTETGARFDHTGAARAQLAQVFLIPIENLHGLSRVQLQLGDAFGQLKHQYGEIEWNLKRIFKEVDNPGQSKSNALKRYFSRGVSKSFLLIQVPFYKSLSEISESRSFGVADALPKQHGESLDLDLLHYTRSSTLCRNPLADLRWWLTCKSNGSVEQRSMSLEKYKSFNEISAEMRSLIGLWRRAAEKQDPGHVNQNVVQRRNHILAQAQHTVIRRLSAPTSYGYASQITKQCAPYAATFLQAFIQTTQSLP